MGVTRYSFRAMLSLETADIISFYNVFGMTQLKLLKKVGVYLVNILKQPRKSFGRQNILQFWNGGQEMHVL